MCCHQQHVESQASWLEVILNADSPCILIIINDIIISIVPFCFSLGFDGMLEHWRIFDEHVQPLSDVCAVANIK